MKTYSKTKAFFGRLAVLTLAGVFFLSGAAFAAVTGTRFHSGSEHDRVVFDLDMAGSYKADLSADGRTLTLTLPAADRKFRQAPIRGTRITSASFAKTGNKLIVTMKLKSGMTYNVVTLKNPSRIFVDVMPKEDKGAAASSGTGKTKPAAGGKPGAEDGAYIEKPADGLTKTSLIYWDDRGQISAWILVADKSKYRLGLALAKGRVPGVEPVSHTAARVGAVAAVNGGYFSATGELLGVEKIDGKIAGTTYYTRSAMGVRKDGSTVFGTIGYDGTVTMDGITKGVSGIDCERGENGVVLYNSLYGSRTGTNEYGMEYTVVDGRVTDIETNDSPIPANGLVVSVHGTAKDAFEGVRVGDPATIVQDIGGEWEDVPTIIGAGPRLVEDGRVHVTAAEEDFPADIRVGRAPRTAVGVTKDGDYIIAVVDGRQSTSVGLTLVAWAELLRKYGAYNAINLDGGGSSEIVIEGDILNSPSDGRERSVGSSVVLFPRR